MMVCLSMMNSTMCLPRPMQHIDRPNYGVHFFASNKFNLISETWQHTLVFTLPQLQIYAEDKPDPPHVLDHMLHTLNRIAKEQTHQLAQTIADIYLIIPEIRLNETRTTREWCPWHLCSRILSTVLGTASEEQLSKAIKTVKEIGTATSQALSMFQTGRESLASFEHSSNTRFETVTRLIQAQARDVQTIETATRNIASKLEQDELLITRSIHKLLSFTININELQILRNAILNLVQGSITADLIPAQRLAAIIGNITTQLGKNHIALRLLTTNPSNIYNSRNFFFWRQGSQLYITLNFDLSPLQAPFTLYNLKALALPIQNHTTMIINLPPYVAWNEIDEAYMEFLTQPPITADTYHIDEGIQVLKHKNKPSCVTAIILDIPNLVTKHCETVLQPKMIVSAIYAIAANRLLLLSIDTYNISCVEQTVRVHQGCESCTIFIPCGCTFESNFGNYVARQMHCTDDEHFMDSSIEIRGHIVNMPLLAAFFNASELAEFAGNSMTTEPINIILPSLEMFSSNYTNDIALLNTQSLQLNYIAEKSKNNTIIFESLAHKLTHDLAERELDIVSSGISIFSYQFIMLIATTGLSLFLAVIVFFMHTKIKSITVALCIIQRVQSAQAQAAINKPKVFDFFRDQTTPLATSIK